jgi:hypothetical protein
MKKNMNRTAKLAFFTARKKSGDATHIAENTGYSYSHIVNIMNGHRSVPQPVADVMYNISRKRPTNREQAAR